ncbi:MAG: hypothetical protein KBD63_02520 [Bacteriovoracaceae bacterium]|nr:hypothetical protein [Bacteriovoracaceae bacterium]
MPYLFLILFSVCSYASAESLDKVVAVIDKKILTLSMVKRIQDTYAFRKMISPLIYKEQTPTASGIINLFVESEVMRSKLETLNYNITDEQNKQDIEERIKKMGTNQDGLNSFLAENNFSYPEYEQLNLMNSIYNILNVKVFSHLIAISEEQVKSSFLKKYGDQATISFNYNLIDFSLDKKINDTEKNEVIAILKDYQKGSPIPEAYKNLEVSDLGFLPEDDLPDHIAEIIKTVAVESFSQPIFYGDKTHYFFVKKKEVIAESKFYLEKKDQIRSALYEESFNKISQEWLNQEKQNHYIKLISL